MDIQRVLTDLKSERDRIEAAMAALMKLESKGREVRDVRSPKKRGRKYMDDEDRKEVSERMRRYWAGRRESSKEMTAGQAAPSGAKAAGGTETAMSATNLAA